jgi:hypothetical protein
VTSILSKIHQQYEDVIRSDKPDAEKDEELSRLMSSMERDFGIPLLQSASWESENKAVIALYRIISESRTSI